MSLPITERHLRVGGEYIDDLALCARMVDPLPLLIRHDPRREAVDRIIAILKESNENGWQVGRLLADRLIEAGK